MREEMKRFRTIFVEESLQRKNAEKMQAGSGMNDYFREYIPYQQGSGIGNYFSQFFRTLKPLAKPFFRTLGKHAFNTAVGVLGDVAHGDNWKDSLKYRAGQTGDRIIGQMQDKVNRVMEGSGRSSGLNFTSDITYNDGGHDSHQAKRIKAARILLSQDPSSAIAGGTKRKSSDSGPSGKRRKTSTKRKSASKVTKAKKPRARKTKKGKKTKKAPKRKTEGKRKAIKAKRGRKKKPVPEVQEGSGYYGWL